MTRCTTGTIARSMADLAVADSRQMLLQCIVPPEKEEGDVEILILIGALGIIPALIAQSKGRNPIGWWIYGCLLWIVALPHSLLISPNADGMLARGFQRCPNCTEWITAGAAVCRYCGRPTREPAAAAAAPLAAGAMKTCPRCAEEVRAAAKACRYCGHDFAAPAASPRDGQNR